MAISLIVIAVSSFTRSVTDVRNFIRPDKTDPDVVAKSDMYSTFLDSVDRAYYAASKREDLIQPFQQLQISLYRIEPFLGQDRSRWSQRVEDYKGFCIHLSKDPERSDSLVQQRVQEFANFRYELSNGLRQRLFP